jgi:hypothetical protein
MKIYNFFLGLAVFGVILNSCTNDDITFPEYDLKTVYFANQYPVRTLVLGDDEFVDNTIDNQRKIEIKAITNQINQAVTIDFRVENSLCNNLFFGNGVKIVPMPSTHYQLASNKISIPKSEILGGVEVQLTDAFFSDPASLTNTYVIPLLLTQVQGADSILQGLPAVDNPDRCIDHHWTIRPQDYVLYAVKYINPWHGNYLRRGADNITDLVAGTTRNVIRREQDEQKSGLDELVRITTNSLTESTLPLTIQDSEGRNVGFDVRLAFAQDQTCIVSGTGTGYSISGTGKFVQKGEKNGFGGVDRNVLYLDYTVNFTTLNLQYATKDTLVVRNRGVAPEYFTVIRR